MYLLNLHCIVCHFGINKLKLKLSDIGLATEIESCYSRLVMMHGGNCNESNDANYDAMAVTLSM